MEWHSQISSSLHEIQQSCLDFQRWRTIACPNMDAFSTELLLREALTNAVVHGGNEDPRLQVFCVLRVKRGRFLISVEDQGSGFDWRKAWNNEADTSETHGRGIQIFRRYADTVRFNSKGNAVTLLKRF